MSGHSKWATIKHKKAATDAKRGKVFTRVIREIQIATREGGPDPESNPRLRTAMTAAKAASMPQENVKRAILRGSGQLEGETYEEITFEGYGAAGVAVIVETVTDNRNRTVSEVRHCFSKNGGNLGENGCVGWIFDKKSLIALPKKGVTEISLLEAALGAGAEDMKDEGDSWAVISDPAQHEAVLKAIESLGVKPLDAEVTMIPQNSVKVTGKQAASVLRLYDALEEQDDVQSVYANFDIDDEELEALTA